MIADMLTVSCSNIVPPPASTGPSLASLALRPLRLPTVPAGSTCPTSTGRSASSFSPFGSGFATDKGMVFALFGGPSASEAQLPLGDPQLGWHGGKVLFFSGPRYEGPAVIRGRRLDGSNPLAFGSPSSPMQLDLTSTNSDTSGGHGWRDWPSRVLAESPGCYGFQVDGASFSEVIVFQALA